MKSLAIFFLLAVLGGPGAAQDGGLLKIVVLEGEGAFNNIKKRVGRDPVVEVRDENDHPVAGAKVMFALPPDGASGTFTGGGKTFNIVTDERGRGATKGMKPNSTEGRFKIKVIASAAGKVGSAFVSQSNTLAGGAIAIGRKGPGE